MNEKVWAAYLAVEDYWFWGQTVGGERLLDAVRDLWIKGAATR